MGSFNEVRNIDGHVVQRTHCLGFVWLSLPAVRSSGSFVGAIRSVTNDSTMEFNTKLFLAQRAFAQTEKLRTRRRVPCFARRRVACYVSVLIICIDTDSQKREVSAGNPDPSDQKSAC